MRIHDDYSEGWNAAAQINDPDSAWSFWKQMLHLRKKYDAMIYGKRKPSPFDLEGVINHSAIQGGFIALDESTEETYAYIREHPPSGQKLLVVLNLSPGSDGRGAPSTFVLPCGLDTSGSKLLISNGEVQEGQRIEGSILLGPWEGRIYLL